MELKLINISQMWVCDDTPSPANLNYMVYVGLTRQSDYRLCVILIFPDYIIEYKWLSYVLVLQQKQHID